MKLFKASVRFVDGQFEREVYVFCDTYSEAEQLLKTQYGNKEITFLSCYSDKVLIKGIQ